MQYITLVLVATLITGCDPPPQKPNQRTPSTSPSGKFVLTVPIEGRYWRVTISDTAGKPLYKDDSKFMGRFNVYWCWDSDDRVWLYNSDDGEVYSWQLVGGRWERLKGGMGSPPDELFPDYLKKAINETVQ